MARTVASCSRAHAHTRAAFMVSWYHGISWFMVPWYQVGIRKGGPLSRFRRRIPAATLRVAIHGIDPSHKDPIGIAHTRAAFSMKFS